MPSLTTLAIRAAALSVRVRQLQTAEQQRFGGLNGRVPLFALGADGKMHFAGSTAGDGSVHFGWEGVTHASAGAGKSRGGGVTKTGEASKASTPRKTAEEKAAEHAAHIHQALEDWKNNRAYIGEDGQYRIKGAYTASGRATIAPWNKAAKAEFPSVDDLHKASQQTTYTPKATSAKVAREVKAAAMETAQQREAVRRAIALSPTMQALSEGKVVMTHTITDQGAVRMIIAPVKHADGTFEVQTFTARASKDDTGNYVPHVTWPDYRFAKLATPSSFSEKPYPLGGTYKTVASGMRALLAQEKTQSATPRTSSTKATGGGKKAPATLNEQLGKIGLTRISSRIVDESEHTNTFDQTEHVTRFADGTQVRATPGSLERLSELVGHPVTVHDAAELFGARPGDYVALQGHAGGVNWYVSSAEDPVTWYAHGILLKGGERGDLHSYISKAHTLPELQGKGIMGEVIARMALAHQAHGVAAITLSAAGWGGGQPGMHGTGGYYSWARMGFNATIKGLVSDGHGGVRDEAFVRDFVAHVQASPYKDAKTIADILKSPGGKAWWLQYGLGGHYTLATKSQSSLSMRIVLGYIKEKHRVSRASLPDAPQQDSGGVDLALTPEDEEILDRVWAEVTGQHDIPTRLAALRAQVATLTRRDGYPLRNDKGEWIGWVSTDGTVHMNGEGTTKAPGSKKTGSSTKIAPSKAASPKAKSAASKAKVPSDTTAHVRSIPIDTIHTGLNPREYFDPEKIRELAESIKANGLLQPITVREHAGSYQLIAGERRFRAMQMLGWTHVPVIVKNVDDKAARELALVENINREDMRPAETARAYKGMIDAGTSVKELAARTGKTTDHINAHLDLLTLPPHLQDLVDKGKLPMGVVRSLAKLSTKGQEEAAERILRDDLGVKSAQRLIRTISERESQISMFNEVKPVTQESRDAQARVQDTLGKMTDMLSGLDDQHIALAAQASDAPSREAERMSLMIKQLQRMQAEYEKESYRREKRAAYAAVQRHQQAGWTTLSAAVARLDARG